MAGMSKLVPSIRENFDRMQYTPSFGTPLVLSFWVGDRLFAHGGHG